MKKLLVALLLLSSSACAVAQDMVLLAADDASKRSTASVRPSSSDPCFVSFGSEAINVNAIQYIRMSNNKERIVIITGTGHALSLLVPSSTKPENALKNTVEYVANCRNRKDEENVAKAKSK